MSRQRITMAMAQAALVGAQAMRLANVGAAKAAGVDVLEPEAEVALKKEIAALPTITRPMGRKLVKYPLKQGIGSPAQQLRDLKAQTGNKKITYTPHRGRKEIMKNIKREEAAMLARVLGGIT